NHINQIRTIDFENGLMGIGCGIEYLIQEGLIRENGNEILEDIDQVLFLVINNEERLQCSQQKVLTGWMKYLMYRLKGQLNYAEDSITIRNKTLFIHCIDLIEYYFEYYISRREELMFLLYKGLSLNIINYKIHRLLSRLEEGYTSCEKQSFEKRENEWMQKKYSQYANLQSDIQVLPNTLKEGKGGVGLYLLTEINHISNHWLSLI
ncbi:MAG: hypothetical protein LUG98_02795, partial [Tannerellaceae bacterium]|nr:hypothetical protein [Tannerellaceae bacterium]